MSLFLELVSVLRSALSGTGRGPLETIAFLVLFLASSTVPRRVLALSPREGTSYGPCSREFRGNPAYNRPSFSYAPRRRKPGRVIASEIIQENCVIFSMERRGPPPVARRLSHNDSSRYFGSIIHIHRTEWREPRRKNGARFSARRTGPAQDGISRVNQPQYHLRDTWPRGEGARGGGFPLATPGVCFIPV